MDECICYYIPHGDSAPYQVGCTLAKYLPLKSTDIRFTFIDSADEKPVCCNSNCTLFHLPVSPWLSTRAYWKWIHHFRRKEIPILVNIHGDYINETMYSLEDRDYASFLKKVPSALFSTRILDLVDYYIVNSRLMEELLIENYRIDSSNIFVIPNGIHISNDAHSPDLCSDTLLFDADTEINLFTHGVLTRRKGVFELVEALTMISDVKFKLFVVGNGPAMRLLQKEVFSLGLQENVVFLGRVASEDIINRYLPKMDVCIYPSKFDGFQIAALESLYFSNGVVLISNMAGVSEFIPKPLRSNIITPDPECIANRITQVISLTDKEREKMVEAQKQFSAQFSWDRIADKYMEVYQKLLEEYL